MSRIIGGAARGRRLKTAAGDETRPTSARVRQSLFDVLAPEILGCRFLDACAGSGGVGLEALSRGAALVVLVDRSAVAVNAARENLCALSGAPGTVEVYRQEALVALATLADRGRSFDVAYLDPPYGSELLLPLLELVGARLLASGGVAVAEHFHKRTLPERIGGLERTRLLRVGDHCLSFYRRAGEPRERTAAGLLGDGGDEEETR